MNNIATGLMIIFAGMVTGVLASTYPLTFIMGSILMIPAYFLGKWVNDSN